MHSVAVHEALVLLVDGGGRSGVRPDVVVQVPAQVLIEHCGQQVEFFVIVPLRGGVETKQTGSVSVFNTQRRIKTQLATEDTGTEGASRYFLPLGKHLLT